jgi:hypothetical protein
MRILLAVPFLILAPVQGALAGDLPTEVTPNTTVTIRESPPGFFRGAGGAVGTATPGETFQVLERKTIPTVIGIDEWLRVQNSARPSERGWINGAPAGGTSNVQSVR